MSGILHSVNLLLFFTNKKIERKSEEFKRIREERFEAMEYAIKKNNNSFLKNIGLVQGSEIDALYQQIEELSKKVETISK